MTDNAITFEHLGLDARLLNALSEFGYTSPTPIQQQAIPLALKGGDLMAGAQTGTGKTAAFALPMLHGLLPLSNASTSPAKHPIRALILTPTRELAIQVEESIRIYAKHTDLRSLVVYGGVDIKTQTPTLIKGVEILVATPGRLLDHVEQRTLSLGQVQTLVLDEADRMLDMGFMPDLKRIVGLLPKKRQTLMFSATFSPEIKKLSETFLNSPDVIEVAKRNSTAETVTQQAYAVSSANKHALLIDLLSEPDATQVIVFTKTKLSASRLAKQLEKTGIASGAIHGDKSQQERIQALDAFKNGEIKALIATDVAARGLDIDQLPLVINYEIPTSPEDYVHRIGRTGRAGAKGKAISLVSPEEEKSFKEIERLIGNKIPLIPASPSSIAFSESETHASSTRAKREPREASDKRDTREKRVSREKIDPWFYQPYTPNPNAIAKPASTYNRSGAKPKKEIAALLGGLKRSAHSQ